MKKFVTNSTAYHRFVKTAKGTKYSFFGGTNPKPVYVKNKEDIKWFENNVEFTEVSEMSLEEIKQVGENNDELIMPPEDLLKYLNKLTDDELKEIVTNRKVVLQPGKAKRSNFIKSIMDHQVNIQ